MFILHWLYENSRPLSLITSSMCLAAMTTSAVLRRSESVRRTRRVFMWFYVLIFTAVLSTGYNYGKGYPPTLPALANVMAFFGIFVAILWHPRGDYLTPHEGDNSTPQRIAYFVDDIVRRIKYGKEPDQEENEDE